MVWYCSIVLCKLKVIISRLTITLLMNETSLINLKLLQKRLFQHNFYCKMKSKMKNLFSARKYHGKLYLRISPKVAIIMPDGVSKFSLRLATSREYPRRRNITETRLRSRLTICFHGCFGNSYCKHRSA